MILLVMKDGLPRLSVKCPAYFLQKGHPTLYIKWQRYELCQICSWLVDKIMYPAKQDATWKLIILSLLSIL